MSGESTSAAGSFARPDDPRLGETLGAVAPGAAVIVGFPTDEGVRRNGGRVGAAAAPAEIRRFLYKLVAIDGLILADAGDVPTSADLEADQLALAEIVRDLLRKRAVPIVLGGGHETAFGVYLGHALAGGDLGILNLDAHLDVRPTVGGLGHSGSPFRQAMEYTPAPVRYVCLGAQPFAVSRDHADYVLGRGGAIAWRDEVAGRLAERFGEYAAAMPAVHLSIDADVVTAADVPGVSAPNPCGLSGVEVIECARVAGSLQNVVSLEVVEINPRFDHDGRSARWAAVAVWSFLEARSRAHSAGR